MFSPESFIFKRYFFTDSCYHFFWSIDARKLGHPIQAFLNKKCIYIFQFCFKFALDVIKCLLSVLIGIRSVPRNFCSSWNIFGISVSPIVKFILQGIPDLMENDLHLLVLISFPYFQSWILFILNFFDVFSDLLLSEGRVIIFSPFRLNPQSFLLCRNSIIELKTIRNMMGLSGSPWNTPLLKGNPSVKKFSYSYFLIHILSIIYMYPCLKKYIAYFWSLILMYS